MKIVGAGFALFSKAVTTVLGGQMLPDAAQFVQLFEDMFGGFRERAQATYELLRAPGTKFVVVSICEADALREASYFTDRLRAEHMPLAGLVLNRTHPPLADLAAGTAAGRRRPSWQRPRRWPAAVLGIHAAATGGAGGRTAHARPVRPGAHRPAGGRGARVALGRARPARAAGDRSPADRARWPRTDAADRHRSGRSSAAGLRPVTPCGEIPEITVPTRHRRYA